MSNKNQNRKKHQEGVDPVPTDDVFRYEEKAGGPIIDVPDEEEPVKDETKQDEPAKKDAPKKEPKAKKEPKPKKVKEQKEPKVRKTKFKDIVTKLFNEDKSVEQIMEKTGAKRNTVRTILKRQKLL